MHIRNRLDLAAFIAILVAGVVLIMEGLSPEALASVASALTVLNGAWTGSLQTPKVPTENVERQDEQTLPPVL